MFSFWRKSQSYDPVRPCPPPALLSVSTYSPGSDIFRSVSDANCAHLQTNAKSSVAYNKCLCCRTRIVLNASQSSFRCKTCLVTNHRSPSSPPASAPPAMVPWSRQFALGRSKPSYKSPDIDYQKVAAYWASPDALAVAQILEMLSHPHCDLSHTTDLRPVLVLMECPSLLDGQDSHRGLGVAAILASYLANCSPRVRLYLVNWILRMPLQRVQTHVTLLNSALSRFLAAGARSRASSSSLHPDTYRHSWQIESCARALAIYSSANYLVDVPRLSPTLFYNPMLDCVDIKVDFHLWQQSTTDDTIITPKTGVSADLTQDAVVEGPVAREMFFFCQYPFLLSMGAKSIIMSYDSRAQMEVKVQEAFFASLGGSSAKISPSLLVRVRRSHLLTDSLQVLANQQENLKKKLRVEYVGEPGVDAGGIKKEWFLLLTRELFNDAKLSKFQTLEESNLSWFVKEHASVQDLVYYRTAGIVLGLAVYNSTILDVKLPLLVFKKLLGFRVTLHDFSQMEPTFGKSLQELLAFSGAPEEFENLYDLNFVATDKDDSGNIAEVPLVRWGEKKPVTLDNRKEYVEKIVDYFSNKRIEAQFTSFKEGFFAVVGSNAITLLHPEELELMICGSAKPLCIDDLKSITQYVNWGPEEEAENHLVIKWFWRWARELPPDGQRKLLMFVTGSDRIPPTGIENIPFRIMNIGGDTDRLPVSHTCFNQLSLYCYSSRAKLTALLDLAINEAEGFMIK